MASKIKQIKLSPEDVAALQRMVYGEAAGSDEATMRMIAQSAVNRLRSGRTKEFGGNMTKVLQKGYYAVSNPNLPYRQALEGAFNDEQSKKKWLQAQNVVNDVIKNQDFGKTMFYFTQPELERLTKKGGFDFSQVVPTENIGAYMGFAYPEEPSHYGR